MVAPVAPYFEGFVGATTGFLVVFMSWLAKVIGAASQTALPGMHELQGFAYSKYVGVSSKGPL